MKNIYSNKDVTKSIDNLLILVGPTRSPEKNESSQKIRL